MKDKLTTLRWDLANGWATTRAIISGIGSVLCSDIVYHEGGLSAKYNLVKGVARYGFTAARQLWYSAKCTPNNVAVIDDLGQMTYRELADDVEAFARALAARGHGRDSRIGVMLRNSRVVIYGLGAKAHIAADIYLLNPQSSPVQLQKSIEEHELDLLIIDEEYAGHLPADWDACDVVIGHAEDVYNPKAPNPAWPSFQQLTDNAPSDQEIKLPWHPKQGKIVIMSSGTSGTPKGVLWREPAFPIGVTSVLGKIPWRKNMMVQQTASLFHSWGWMNLNMVLAHRATVILHRHFDPVQAMEDLERYEVDAIASSPIFLKEQLKVAQAGDYKHKQMEFICSSGNAMLVELYEGLRDQFGPSIQNFYGSTEVSLCTIADAEELAANPQTSGSAAAGVRLEIHDDEGNVLPPNTPGRIYTHSVTSMRRYTNPRDKMRISRGLLEIGDRGYIDDHGQLIVQGRADDMIIVGGENVYPRSCEEILARMPGVGDLYIRGVEDPDTFQRLAAWVVREDNATGAALTEESIQEYVASKLAEHSIPRDVIFMDDLPRNPTGKVMPRMLPMPETPASSHPLEDGPNTGEKVA